MALPTRSSVVLPILKPLRIRRAEAREFNNRLRRNLMRRRRMAVLKRQLLRLELVADASNDEQEGDEYVEFSKCSECSECSEAPVIAIDEEDEEEAHYAWFVDMQLRLAVLAGDSDADACLEISI